MHRHLEHDAASRRPDSCSSEPRLLPATVVTPAQTAHVTGPASAQVALLQVEAGLFTAGLTSGDSTSIRSRPTPRSLVNEYDATIGLPGASTFR